MEANVGVGTPAIERGEDPRPVIRLGMLVVLGGVVAGGVWLAHAPLAAAVVAPALVKVDMNRKVVQHQEGGIVREIRVRDGDRVMAGQTLLVIEDVRVDASLDLLRQQTDAEHARNARLTSERSLTPQVAFPPDLVQRAAEPRVAEVLERERALFMARRQTLDSQVDLLRAQIRHAADEATAIEQQIAAERRAFRLMNEEVLANEDLLKKNYVQRTRVLSLARSAAEYEAQLGEHEAERSRARQKAKDLELKIVAARNSYVQAAADELKDSTNRLFELEERLRPSQDASRRQNVTAPVDGEVVDLRVTTVGAVIGPRDPILDVVPTSGRLIVEAHIKPEEVNDVRLKAEAAVRLTAFTSRLTPLVDGKVTYVSADRLTDRDNGAGYYTVHVEVQPESLRQAGTDIYLQAGMPAEVFIKVRERMALEYLIEPVTTYVRRAFREP